MGPVRSLQFNQHVVEGKVLRASQTEIVMQIKKCELLRQQHPDLFQNLARDRGWQSANKRHVAGLPIQTLDLIRENRSADREALGQVHLKGIPFDLAGDSLLGKPPALLGDSQSLTFAGVVSKVSQP